MTKAITKIIAGSAGAALLLLAIWINFDVLVDAFGSGPPYYSRSVNVDKWTNPLPYLIPADVVVIGLTVAAFRFVTRKYHPHA